MFTIPVTLAGPLVSVASGQVPTCNGTLVTSTASVHVVATAALAPTVVPATVMVLAPATAVIVPPVQVLTTFGTAAICSLVGSVSTKLTTCAGLLAAGLVMVNVSVVVPPAAIVVGLNALFKLGVCCVTVTQLGVTALVTLTRPVRLAEV